MLIPTESFHEKKIFTNLEAQPEIRINVWISILSFGPFEYKILSFYNGIIACIHICCPRKYLFPSVCHFLFFNNTRIFAFYSHTLAGQKKNYIHKEEIYIFKLKLLLFLYFRYYNKEKKKYISILWKLFEKLCDLFGGQYNQKQKKIEIP